MEMLFSLCGGDQVDPYKVCLDAMRQAGLPVEPRGTA
jgi:hypothetical protein